MYQTHRWVGRLAALLLAGNCCWLSAAEIPEGSPVAAELRAANAAVEKIVAIPDEQRTFDNTVGAIDDLVARLFFDTNMVQFMAYVSTDAEERERGTLAEQHISDWMVDFSQREDLYRAVKAYADTNPQLEGEQARLLEHTLRDYRRAGMDLPKEKRDRLAEVQKEINKLGIDFEKNIREDETRVLLTRAELRGMPDEFFEKPDLVEVDGVYLCGLEYPTFMPVMKYCDNETARKKMWIEFKRKGGQKNVDILERILKLRAEAAKLLGYEHPAAYEIEIRMAKTAENVMEFYNELRPLVRKKAKQDYEEFRQAKAEHTGNDDAVLYPWDYWFYENLLRQQKYNVDSQKVKEYFPLTRVIDGLFSITQSMYGLEYRDVTNEAASRGRPLWHPDVRLYEVRDTATDEMLGEFYLDLHPRPNKYSHAAQWSLVQHKVWPDGTVSKPLAALVCNFPKPSAGKPALLPHDDVETFFHEFGHCLHTILSDARYLEFSGTNVARDFVEAPSQMFENWVWSPEVLQTFARHYATNEPIPTDLVKGMLRARHLGSGMQAERQFFYGLVDLAYHTDSEGDVDTTIVGIDLSADVEMYPRIEGTHFQSGFGHLVGYQAGYYGYMWSRVYAEDMFQRFARLGMLNPEAGMYYRKKILAPGGTRDAMTLVEDYLGREPEMDAFLRYLGLENENDEQ